jgi:hypothetical protein
MAETFEIKRYTYYLFSSRNASSSTGVVLFYGATKYLGGAFFSDDPNRPLDPAVKYPSGVYGLYYRMSDMPVVIDMLRNEQPIYLIYDGEQNTRLSTTEEPVGEGEV